MLVLASCARASGAADEYASTLRTRKPMLFSIFVIRAKTWIPLIHTLSGPCDKYKLWEDRCSLLNKTCPPCQCEIVRPATARFGDTNRAGRALLAKHRIRYHHGSVEP